jgi:methylphosphotriester-DNA--protein-cysteine methyltransferase
LANWRQNRIEGSGKPTDRTPEVIDAVEEIVENELKTSLHHLSLQVNLSVETCRTIFKKDLHLYPYRTILFRNC